MSQAWIRVNIDESNCSQLAKFAVQRSKELDELCYTAPNKMYKYIDKFWDRPETIDFLKNYIEENGFYYVAPAEYRAGRLVLSYTDKGRVLTLKHSVLENQKVPTGVTRGKYDFCMSYMGINLLYKKYEIFEIVKPTSKWLTCIEAFRIAQDRTHKNADMIMYALDIIKANKDSEYLHVNTFRMMGENWKKATAVDEEVKRICLERKTMREFPFALEAVHS